MRTATRPTIDAADRRSVRGGCGELAPYLSEIGAYPVLTAEEELALGRRAAAGDDAARTRLVLCTLRLVVEVARRYRCSALSVADLIQEGNVGLMRAAEKYDYTRGHRFSTYAVWWIRMAMTRAIKSQGTTIRVPAYLYGRLDAGGEQPPTRQALRDSADHARTVISLDAARPTGEDGDGASPIALVADRDAPTVEEETAGRCIVRDVRSVMALLPPRDRAIIAYRYGVAGAEPHSLAETAAVFGVRRQRIAQIEARALTTLKMRAYNRGLQEYVVAP